MNIFNEKQKAGISRMKLILNVGAFTKKWQKQMRNSKQRYNILKEWSETETSYIEDLKTI